MYSKAVCMWSRGTRQWLSPKRAVLQGFARCAGGYSRSCIIPGGLTFHELTIILCCRYALKWCVPSPNPNAQNDAWNTFRALFLTRFTTPGTGFRALFDAIYLSPCALRLCFVSLKTEQVVDIIHPGVSNVSKTELGEMVAKVSVGT